MKATFALSLAIPSAVAAAAFVFVQRDLSRIAEPPPAAAKSITISENPSPVFLSTEPNLSSAEMTQAPAKRERPIAEIPTHEAKLPTVIAPHPDITTPEIASSTAHSAAASATPTAASRLTAQPRASAAMGGSIPAMEFIVPRAAILPAAFLDSAEGASEAQGAALDRLAHDFLSELAAAEAPKPPPVSPSKKQPARPGQPDRWDAATRLADERYRQLFGVEAYNAWTAAAAKEALAEK